MKRLVVCAMVVLFCVGVDLRAATVAAPQNNLSAKPQASPSPALDVNAQLRSAVEKAEPTLGTLEPWQKKLFEDEVVPRYQRFIRDYQSSEKGVNAELDLDGIKNYLKFYAPQSLKRPDLRIVLFVRSEPGCEKCAQAVASIKQMMKARMEARGFTPIWITLDESIKDPNADPKLVDDKVAEQFQRLNTAAGLVLRMQLKPSDDIESVHADEKQYWIHSLMLVRDFPREEGSLELLEEDNLEISADRLITDALTDLGSKSSSVTAAPILTADREEVTVQVSGLADYTQFSQAKTLLQTRLKSFGTIEERKVSRGMTLFAVITKKKAADVKAALEGVSLNVTEVK